MILSWAGMCKITCTCSWPFIFQPFLTYHWSLDEMRVLTWIFGLFFGAFVTVFQAPNQDLKPQTDCQSSGTVPCVLPGFHSQNVLFISMYLISYVMNFFLSFLLLIGFEILNKYKAEFKMWLLQLFQQKCSVFGFKCLYLWGIVY